MARTRVGSGDFGHWLWLVLGAILFSVAVHEGADIAEHGIDNWRRRRFGW